MSINDDIGQRLTLARETAGLSREQVAQRLNVSVSTIQAHENGRNGLKPDSALAYMRLYKVSLQWLFEGKEPMRGTSEVVDIVSRIRDGAEKEAWLAMGRAIAKSGSQQD